MIEIKFTSNEKTEEICAEYGITRDAGLRIYLAMENDAPLGFCAFTSGGENGTIIRVVSHEKGLLLADGLIRAALSYMLGHGVRRVVCLDGGDTLLRRLKFENTDGVYSLELSEDYFSGC